MLMAARSRLTADWRPNTAKDAIVAPASANAVASAVSTAARPGLSPPTS
jgi:hypothetical protein